MRNDSGSNQGSGSRDVKSSLESGHNLKGESTRFPDGLDVGYGRTREIEVSRLRDLPST